MKQNEVNTWSKTITTHTPKENCPFYRCLNDYLVHVGTRTVYTAHLCPSSCLLVLHFSSNPLTFSHQTQSPSFLADRETDRLPLRTSSAAASRSSRSVCFARRGRLCCRCPVGGPTQQGLPVCAGASLCSGVWCHCEKIQGKSTHTIYRSPSPKGHLFPDGFWSY